MKLYKFRPLAGQEDYKLAKSIIETGRFWCSRFSELNDPMEGIFLTKNPSIVNDIYNEKNKYKICSFSGKTAFEKPCMWGYYAKGFKGIAIEIKVNDGEVKKIDYKKDIHTINGTDQSEIEAVLTTKLTSWKHEAEQRFLKESEENEHAIGSITAVYFGEPYSNIGNSRAVYNDNQILQCYKCFRNQLITILRENDIKCSSIKFENNKVKKGDEIHFGLRSD